MLATNRTACALLVAGLVLPPLVGWPPPARPQEPPAKSFTLDEAVRYALENYPAIRASLEKVSGAKAGVDIARTHYLPRLDSLWQSNRATDNNIAGLLFPQPFLPSISGPVPPSPSYRGVWGSAGGVLFTWEPFDFGLRHAEVRAAGGTVHQASSGVALTQLQVATAVADAFVTVLADQQTLKAAEADLERRQVLAKSVHVLVDNQLRPGADASRADAEVAAARIQMIQAQGAEQSARGILATLMGTAGTPIAIESGPLLALPTENSLPASQLSSHPLALSEQATIEELRDQEHVLKRTDYPRFYFQSSFYGRGSGIGTDGSFASGLNGLGLERGNWAVGITVLFPNLFDFVALRARKQALAADERAETARYNQALQDLTGQLGQARIKAQTAWQVAQNTPVELDAARASETQARARYQAGLATLVEVADAQSLLAQAEIGDAISRVGVWRSLLGVAYAQGDLEPFLQLLGRTSPGGH